MQRTLQLASKSRKQKQKPRNVYKETLNPKWHCCYDNKTQLQNAKCALEAKQTIEVGGCFKRGRKMSNNERKKNYKVKRFANSLKIKRQAAGTEGYNNL